MKNRQTLINRIDTDAKLHRALVRIVKQYNSDPCHKSDDHVAFVSDEKMNTKGIKGARQLPYAVKYGILDSEFVRNANDKIRNNAQVWVVIMSAKNKNINTFLKQNDAHEFIF